MPSKSRFLKLHDAIFDLQKVIYIERRLDKLWFYFDAGQTSFYEFESSQSASEVLDQCYEIMKE